MALIAKTSMKPFGNTDGYIKQNITFHLETQSPTGFNFITPCSNVMPRWLQYKLEAPSTCSSMVKRQVRENWQEETASVFLNLLILHRQDRDQNGARGSLNISVLPKYLQV